MLTHVYYLMHLLLDMLRDCRLRSTTRLACPQVPP